MCEATTPGVSSESMLRRIDRHTVVRRHDPILTALDKSSPLQVGNGNFAFNADITGLQTFYGNTLSSWAWHESPDRPGTPDQPERAPVITHKRRRFYLAPNDQPELWQWLWDNPHRVNLGRLGLVGRNGDRLSTSDIGQPHQRLDLWRGTLQSRFTWRGLPVSVETVAHPTRDIVAVSITSPALADGNLALRLDFPYPVPVDGEFYLGDWARPEDHTTTTHPIDEHRFDLTRAIDDTRYRCRVGTSGRWTPAAAAHTFRIAASDDRLDMVCEFARSTSQPTLPGVADCTASAAEHWESFWTTGGIVDLSASTDERWEELERRIVLSQYLTAVNSTGASPPQESGLRSNSWSGKFHLEMTAWHGAHFTLWQRTHLLDGWRRWLRDIGLPAAQREAACEGWRGAKWLKTTDPDARWESWDHGPNRITQNATPFVLAELDYRARPTVQTLDAWKDILFETATMIADFVAWDHDNNRYVLGPPVMSGAEANSGFTSWNATSDLNYWAYSLEIAQRWRQRLGWTRYEHWTHVLDHLSTPPIVDGVYIDAESHPEVWNQATSQLYVWHQTTDRSLTTTRFIRPAWFESYGCLPGPLIDPATMEATYQRAARQIRNGDWAKSIWGTDFPMMAMTAARLGKADEAVEWLLEPSPSNSYSAAGFCNTWYLPGNGGLLWAIALMSAGWDGGPTWPAPGFPTEGSWRIQYENLSPSP